MNRAFQLIFFAIIVLIILDDGKYMSMHVKEILYTISVNAKEIILFILPFGIITLFAKNTAKIGMNMTKIAAIAIIGIVLSNTFGTLSAYAFKSMINKTFSVTTHADNPEKLNALYRMKLPQSIPAHLTIVLGIAIGIAVKKINNSKLLEGLETVLKYFFRFIRLMIPLYVIGGVSKLQHDGLISMLSENFQDVIVLLLVAYAIYLFMVGFICFQSLDEMYEFMGKVIPIALLGGVSMCSMITLPMLLQTLKKKYNTNEITEIAAPISINNHLIGDCITIPIISFIVGKMYGFPAIDIYSYIIFTVYFVIAKFSILAIPGGGIIVMLPILQHCFGYGERELATITALYILLDFLITFVNVLANAMFMVLLNRVVIRVNYKVLR
ncbi:cation:dicarboxylate symporter family transporter [Candidatus Fokinia crypta]|uniref:Sodium:dicarboxylate symporter family protein n=1 Tax=Candidatus Fokinia crypta TaxID=1920990 RepID=A0ABZ0UPR3_9RICK|nr:cation:dicarboxylase symporter family transporter [Candidatus Fokinia cryptica]WPX97532.1 Sodium:dicarboxylate symporter family protein [Candidatus Fokinia cryptica]